MNWREEGIHYESKITSSSSDLLLLQVEALIEDFKRFFEFLYH